MNKKLVRNLGCVIAASTGCLILYVDIINIMYVFGISFVMIWALGVKVKLRNKNYIGLLISPYPKSMFHELNKREIDAALIILSFMASPIIMSLLVVVYGVFIL